MENKLKKALETILSQPSKGLIAYAQTYADAALTLGRNPNGKIKTENNIIEIEMEKTGKEMEGQELKTQLFYVLSNLDGWKGEKARETKKVIKEYATSPVLAL